MGKTVSAPELVENRVIGMITKLGLPTAITCFFLCWFFYYYFPKHEEFIEKRFREILQESERNRQTQMEIINKQSEIFQNSLRDIMKGVERLVKAVSALERRIEAAESKHVRALDKGRD